MLTIGGNIEAIFNNIKPMGKEINLSIVYKGLVIFVIYTLKTLNIIRL